MRLVKEDIEATGEILLTTAELAEKIGRTLCTVARWRKDEVLLPSHYDQRGKTTVWLYDDATVQKAKRVARTLKPGRPRS